MSNQLTDLPNLNDLIFRQLGDIRDIALSLSTKELHRAIDDFKRITDQLVAHAQGSGTKTSDISVAPRRNCVTAISIMEHYVKEANSATNPRTSE